MKLHKEFLEILNKEVNKTIIDIALLQKVLGEHNITVEYDEKLVDEVLSKYNPDGVDGPPSVPISVQRGEEHFYINSTMWMNTQHDYYYGITIYCNFFELDSHTMDTIFHLYVINSGNLTNEDLDSYMEIPVAKERIGHIPYEIIRMAANQEAERANKIIGIKIY